MAYNSSKLATLPRRLAAHLLLSELQAEARLERAMGLWDATFPDDDTTTLPNPMDNPAVLLRCCCEPATRSTN
jgi:hypothetical protein